MAEIVNGALSVRKKDLYDHKSFKELYDYNQVISNLRAASKKSFVQYINTGVSYWKDRFSAFGWDFGEKVLSDIDPDDAEKLRAEGDVFYMPLNNLTEEFEQTEDHPTKLAFSLIEITDPLVFKFEKEDYPARKAFEHLNSYIELGLFPMVMLPMEEQDIFDVFEKYDEVRPYGKTIGTIVNCFHGHDANDKEVIYACVMWDINFTAMYEPSMFECKAGYLKMTNAIPTPDVWRDANDVNRSNFAIPYYEYHSYEAIADIIAGTPELQKKVDEMAIIGQVQLGYVNFLTAKLQEAAQNPPQTVESTIIGENATDTKVDVLEDSVPIEDASEEDLLGHRMRLYDEPDVGFAPPSITAGIVELSTDEILEEF